MAHLEREELIQWRDYGRADQRERVVSHLASCPSCAAVYAELVRTAPVADAPVLFDPKDFVQRGYAVRRDAAPAGWLGWASVSWKAWGAVAAALVVMLVLVGPRRDTFTTLSGSPGAAPGVRLTVIFQPDTTEAAIRSTLLEIDGTIVSGPSALGVYIVALPAQVDDEREADALVEKLRSDTGVIRFVEREP